MESLLYRELSQSELESLIKDCLHEDLISSGLLSGGLFNTTYGIETSVSGDLVLRLGPVNRHLLLPYEHHLMEAEAEVYRLCAEHGVPASEVVFCDTSKTLIDRDIMIVRRIQSKAMHEAGLTEAGKEEVSRDAGRAAAALHRISAPSFGRIYDVMRGKGCADLHSALTNEFDETASACLSAGISDEKEFGEALRLIGAAKPIINEVSVPSLVHCDLWEGNILVGGHPPKFLAVIDADRGFFGDPLMEFSAVGWMRRSPAFWEGYGKPLPDDGASRLRMKLYEALFSLSYAYIYLAEYRDGDLSARELESFRRRVSEISAEIT